MRGSELSGEGASLTRSPAAAGDSTSPSRDRRAPRLVLLGEFGRAHGLAGEVRLKSFTADPRAIAGYGPLLTAGGTTLRLTGLRRASGDQPDLLVARVEGVGSREAAETLNRVALFVERERLGTSEDPDEFYLTDLVGLTVEGPDGPVGRVAGLPDFGGGEILEIAPAGGGPTRLLPFTRAFVPDVDIAGGRVTIAPPPGFWEDRVERDG